MKLILFAPPQRNNKMANSGPAYNFNYIYKCGKGY